MTANYLDFFVEERSMEVFLRGVLPRMLSGCLFDVRVFRGKHDLLQQLDSCFRGRGAWMPDDYRLVVLADRDADDCRELKRKLEAVADRAGLRTRKSAGGRPWQVANRIVVEELEAWYFGDWDAVRCAYPKVSRSIPRQAGYRDPDAIRGGTAEAFERILKQSGYFRDGLNKNRAAEAIAGHIQPERNRSRSFQVFREALDEAMR